MRPSAATTTSELQSRALGDTPPLPQTLQREATVSLRGCHTDDGIRDVKQRAAALHAESQSETTTPLDGMGDIKTLIASIRRRNGDALEAMRVLHARALKSQKTQERIGEAGGVDALVDLFSINQREPNAIPMLLSAVTVLDTLVNASQNLQRFGSRGAVETILSVFPDAPPDLQRAIIGLLTKLQSSRHVHNALVRESSRPFLFSVLQPHARAHSDSSARIATITLLGQLVAVDVVSREAISANIELFVEAIHDGSPEEQEVAVDATLMLAKDSPANVISAALRCGLVDAFVNLMHTAERIHLMIPRIEQLIAKLSRTRSTEVEGSVVAIFRSMLELTQSASGQRGRAAAAQLVSWAESPEWLDPLLDAGLVGVAASALSQAAQGQPASSSFTPQDALDVMSVISLSHYNSRLMHDGATDALIAVLKNAQPGFREPTTMILYNTSWSHPPLRSVLGTSGCLDIFVDMLRDGTQDEKDAAAGALAAACIDCERNVARFPHNELLDLSVAMLLTGEDHAPNAALRLVKSLADDPAVGEDVARHATIVKLTVQLLVRSDSGNQIHAALAIEAFARHAVSLEQMIQLGVESALRNVRDTEPAEFARMALYAVWVGINGDSL